MATKAELHKIVDQLTDAHLDAAAHYLVYLRDFAGHDLAGDVEEPDDYDSLSSEVIRDIEESREDIRTESLTPIEDVRNELGL